MAVTVADFVSKYPRQGPNRPADTPDQTRELTVEDGVIALDAAPFPEPMPGRPGFPEGKHLWVIFDPGLPVLLEMAPRVRPPPLSSGCAKHTNLTGGRPACCGGELWVDPVSASRLWINGGSGRYQPRTPAELEDAVRVFQGLGYQVVSAGWNDDNGKPARVFRES